MHMYVNLCETYEWVCEIIWIYVKYKYSFGLGRLPPEKPSSEIAHLLNKNIPLASVGCLHETYEIFKTYSFRAPHMYQQILKSIYK